MPARDNQYTKFYKAWDSVEPIGTVIDHEYDAEQFVLRVVTSLWWRNRSDIRDVEIEFHKNARIYYPKANSKGLAKLKLDRPPYTQGGLLIRLCQALRPPEAAYHGPELCRALLDAVDRFCEDGEKQRLQEAFVAHKVKHRVVSPSARAAARERWEKRKISINQQTKASSELNDWLKELKD